ncbi:MAG TPA: fatty acid desaturase [Alphaproteobacteria bacterium]|nr:fatty acid desaturase [Alphaproteobacteria bacterium]
MMGTETRIGLPTAEELCSVAAAQAVTSAYVDTRRHRGAGRTLQTQPKSRENPAKRPNSATESRPNGNYRLNLFLICVVLGGTLFQLFGMPFMLRGFGMRAGWVLFPIMLLQPLHWGLIHEAIHSRLLPKRRINEFCARLLSVTHGLPFDATRVCHLVHHRFSRHGYDRPDVYDGRGAYALAWLRYRGRLFGGVYLGLLASSLIAFVPVSLGVRLMENAIPIDEEGDTNVRRTFVSLVLNVPKRRRTRREFAMTLALYGASAWIYGAWWPMLLAAMYVRGVWHSLADNVAHHAVSLDEPERARNYSLPLAFRPLVMNQHLHLTHHRYPSVPWTSLAAMSESEDAQPRGNYFRAALRQLGPCYPTRISLALKAPASYGRDARGITDPAAL